MDNFITSLLTPKDIARFWSKVDKTPGYGPWGDCWKWMAARNHGQWGYGRFTTRRNGRKYQHAAHKLSYVMAGNVVPAGLSVLHSCDIKDCVNPEHLSHGSHAANTADMISKGRHAMHGRKARFTADHGVRLRLADIAISQGINLTRLQQTSGLPPQIVANIWYNRALYVPLEALDKLSKLLGANPGEFFEKAA
jgi:DNA-binding Xre family transcriptional regulator